MERKIILLIFIVLIIIGFYGCIGWNDAGQRAGYNSKDIEVKNTKKVHT